MSYWPLDTPYRLVTVMAAPCQTPQQLVSAEVLLHVDILIVLQLHKACPSRIFVDKMEESYNSELLCWNFYI